MGRGILFHQPKLIGSSLKKLMLPTIRLKINSMLYYSNPPLIVRAVGIRVYSKVGRLTKLTMVQKQTEKCYLQRTLILPS